MLLKITGMKAEEQSVPNCAAHGCSKGVLIDRSIQDPSQQLFKYCSKECRNANLATYSIEKDISDLEKKIHHTVSDSDVSQFITGNKTPCRSCQGSFQHTGKVWVLHFFVVHDKFECVKTIVNVCSCIVRTKS